MKISINSKWPFFEAYFDSKYITIHDTRQIIVLKEPREVREYRVENKSGKDIVVYKIDGGLIDDNNLLKCDFGVYTEDDILFFIELKGSDYIHALEQLLNTVNILVVKPQIKIGSLNARIVLSKMNVPRIIPTQEKKLIKLLKCRNGDFIKQSQVLKEVI